MALRLLLTLSSSLEILAGLPALITPAPVASLLLGSPLDSIGVVLARLFDAGVFALGLACLKARNDVGSPAGLAVSIGITAYNVLAVAVLLWLQQGQTSAACCCGERGLSMRFSACYSCPSFRGRDGNLTERGSVDRALCVNQHPSVRSCQSRELVKGGMS